MRKAAWWADIAIWSIAGVSWSINAGSSLRWTNREAREKRCPEACPPTCISSAASSLTPALLQSQDPPLIRNSPTLIDVAMTFTPLPRVSSKAMTDPGMLGEGEEEQPLIPRRQDHPGADIPRGGYTPGTPKETKSNKEDSQMVNIYCLKCRGKKDIEGAEAVTMKNGKPAIQGLCPECGTKVFRIGEVKAGESL